MKYCPNCGAALPDEAVFCGACGTKISAAPAGGFESQAGNNAGLGSQVGNGAGYSSQIGNGVNQETSRRAGGGVSGRGSGNGGNKSWIMLLAILAALVLGLAVAAFFLLRDRGGKEETAESKTSPNPTIQNVTPAPGGSTGENSGEMPALPPLFGQESSEAAEEGANTTEAAPEGSAVPGEGNPAATEAAGQTNPGEAAPGQTPNQALPGGNAPNQTAPGQTVPGQTPATPVPTVELTPIPTPAGHVDSTDVHRYEVIIRDVTWYDAWNDAISRGGYLVRINSAAEMQAVCDVLNAQSATNIHYYLGGSCDTVTKQYHWMDYDGSFFDEVISDQNSWYGSYWYPNEPSYVDTELAQKGTTVEEYWMNLINVNGSWYFNDANYDLVGLYPDWLKGKVGYIVEYE